MSMEHMVENEQSSEFMDLFVADQSMIYAFVRSLVPNYSDAEEIFQQVAMTLWRKKETFDPELGTFRAWAIGIARNHIRNFNRREYRNQRLQIFAPDVLDRIAEGWEGLDDSWAERQAALKTCVGKLPETDRERLELHYGSDARAADIAEAEGIPLRTFYRKIQKIRKFLLDCISKTTEAEGGAHGRY